MPEETRRPVRIHAPGCPACSCRLAHPVPRRTQVFTCANCEALFGTCYLGESYEMVMPQFVQNEPSGENIRYYDFTCLGSKGVTRRHGWYDPATKLIVQVG